jgi:DNA-binding NtrC family response regulator
VIKYSTTVLHRGAYDFITKPVDFENLTLTMEKTLKHARHSKQTLQAHQGEQYPENVRGRKRAQFHGQP